MFRSGTDGKDKLDGCHNDNTMCGKDGDDRLEGNKGNDTIYGGEGDDFIQGGDGKDKIWGAEGNDKLFGGRGEDILSDRDGINVVDGGHGKDIFMLDGKREDYRFEMQNDGSIIVTRVDLPEGKEFQTTLKNIEVIRFRNEDVNHNFDEGKLGDTVEDTDMSIQDVINGCYQNVEDLDGVEEDIEIGDVMYDFHYDDATGDSCFIGGGDINQFSPDTNYFIQGSGGDDKIGGNDGNDRLQGGSGNDRMWGGDGDDIMKGGDDNDTVKGGAGNDKLHGGKGDDYVSGEQGDDVIFGDSGNDDVDGGVGNDTLYGGAGNDHLWGCAGDDILVDEEGTNIINGGAGEDTFVLTGSQEDYVFTQGESGVIIVTSKADDSFETTLIDVENVVFDASEKNLEFEHLPGFIDGAESYDIAGLVTDA